MTSKYSEEIYWLASKTFSDEHYGIALTQEELNQRLQLEEYYKEEMDIVKEIIAKDPSFQKFSFQENLDICASMILALRRKKDRVKILNSQLEEKGISR